jgi:hypothetical protein
MLDPSPYWSDKIFPRSFEVELVLIVGDKNDEFK